MIKIREEFSGSYNRLFLVQDRNVLQSIKETKPFKGDLVLSFDYGVIKDMEGRGISAGVLDRVIDPREMDKYNYATYDFFENWHKDETGKDCFSYMGIDFGKTMRQEIWNDITYSARVAFSIKAVQGISSKEIFCALSEPIVSRYCSIFGIENRIDELKVGCEFSVYLFPIFKWVNEKVRPTGLKIFINNFKQKLFFRVRNVLEYLRGMDKELPGIFIQLYHPTRPIAKYLIENEAVKIYSDSDFDGFSKFSVHQKIPLAGVSKKNESIGLKILEKFDGIDHHPLMVEDVDIASEIFAVMRKQIKPRIGLFIATIELLLKYYSIRRLDAVVLIANIGMVPNILLAITQKRGIPSFLVINGYLSKDFCFEGKDADWINSYGEEIKKNYFKGKPNIVCLGDPRMDEYLELCNSPKNNNNENELLQITIGAGGYSPIDLNSCLSVEYIFLDTVLKACKAINLEGYDFNIILKVRANGYKDLYEHFVNEFCPELTIDIVDNEPMIDVLKRSDFYISIYSQTHLEASLLGIPSVYVKTDGETLDPPFDGHSELYTIFDTSEMYEVLMNFINKGKLESDFLDRTVLEKYWGQLDGKCTLRNAKFLMDLVSEGG